MLTDLFQKALKHQQQGETQQAIDTYRALLAQYPDHIASRYNLAGILADEQRWDDAIVELEKILLQEPTCTPACYNLAICYFAQGKEKEAQHYLEQTLALDPKHALASKTLGSLLLKQEKFEEAKSYLLAAMQTLAMDPDIYFNLGLAFLNEGDKNSALYYFTRLRELHPHNIDAPYNCAVIYQQAGNSPAALRAYADVLQQNPEHYPSLYNTAQIYHSLGEYEMALDFYKRAQKVEPYHKNLNFLIEALEQHDLKETPTEYVQMLFDSYADHYEQHMRQKLHYSVPQLLYKLFTDNVAPLEKNYGLIDLGCGTGLVGEYFHPLCHTMIGIDLSTPMLRQASLKQIYHTLAQQDNVDYLKKLQDAIDIIVAADVLGYYGDLRSLFSAVYNSLITPGYFLFSIESYTGNEDFHLQKNARFAHNPRYVEHLAKELGFEVLAKEQATLRFQQELPVMGILYLMRK